MLESVLITLGDGTTLPLSEAERWNLLSSSSWSAGVGDWGHTDVMHCTWNEIVRKHDDGRVIVYITESFPGWDLVAWGEVLESQNREAIKNAAHRVAHRIGRLNVLAESCLEKLQLPDT